MMSPCASWAHPCLGACVGTATGRSRTAPFCPKRNAGVFFFYSVLALLSHRAILFCPGMEFVAQSRSVPDSVPQKLELRGMWDPCLIANAFDPADEFQAYVEHVSVVLVALCDACCKWTDARVSLAGRSRSSLQAVSLVLTPSVPLAPPLVACVPVVRPKRRASWLPRHPRRKAIPVPGLNSSAVVFRVYVDELWDKFIVLGSDGAPRHEFVALPAALQADYQALTKERLAKFSTTTLSAALTALARWQDWQLRAGHVGPPTALAVSLWLRSLQDASSTSARGGFFKP